MGFILLPVIVFSFLMSISFIERNQSQQILPPTIVLQSAQAGATFVAYRNAVAVYQRNNPSFTGTVSNAVLASQGAKFSAEFLEMASNAITATGNTGRIITSYAALPTGAGSDAYDASEKDLSIGIASGGAWSSIPYGSPSTPLSTSVPNGNVVSVVQIGN
jgi:hypothetical protein